MLHLPLLCSPVLPLEHHLDVAAALVASQSHVLSYLARRLDGPAVHLNDDVTFIKVDIVQRALRVKVSDYHASRGVFVPLTSPKLQTKHPVALVPVRLNAALLVVVVMFFPPPLFEPVGG